MCAMCLHIDSSTYCDRLCRLCINLLNVWKSYCSTLLDLQQNFIVYLDYCDDTFNYDEWRASGSQRMSRIGLGRRNKRLKSMGCFLTSGMQKYYHFSTERCFLWNTPSLSCYRYWKLVITEQIFVLFDYKCAHLIVNGISPHLLILIRRIICRSMLIVLLYKPTLNKFLSYLLSLSYKKETGKQKCSILKEDYEEIFGPRFAGHYHLFLAFSDNSGLYSVMSSMLYRRRFPNMLFCIAKKSSWWSLAHLDRQYFPECCLWPAIDNPLLVLRLACIRTHFHRRVSFKNSMLLYLPHPRLRAPETSHCTQSMTR